MINKEVKIGDHILIRRARTLGGGSFHIKVESKVKGNKFKGTIQTGHSAGSKQTGDYINHIVKEELMTVDAIAGTGDSRLPVDQREPAINNKKKPLRVIIKRKK